MSKYKIRYKKINMSVKTLAETTAEGKEVEILFWVGCAGSFDARAQRVTKAFVQILDKANISYAILGNEEMCTGAPARRPGNELVFRCWPCRMSIPFRCMVLKK